MVKRNSWQGLLAILLLFSFILVGCGISTEDLERDVRASMEETFRERGLNIVINSFSLIKRSSTEYRGLLEATELGRRVTYGVNVIVDGRSFMWEID